jgi:hypothetical protein
MLIELTFPIVDVESCEATSGAVALQPVLLNVLRKQQHESTEHHPSNSFAVH